MLYEIKQLVQNVNRVLLYRKLHVYFHLRVCMVNPNELLINVEFAC